MKKALGSASLALLLSMGFATTATAQTNSGTQTAQG